MQLSPVPHSRGRVPSGLAIRKLAGKLFECRGNLTLRFIFQDPPTDYLRAFG